MSARINIEESLRLILRTERDEENVRCRVRDLFRDWDKVVVGPLVFCEKEGRNLSKRSAIMGFRDVNGAYVELVVEEQLFIHSGSCGLFGGGCVCTDGFPVVHASLSTQPSWPPLATEHQGKWY